MSRDIRLGKAINALAMSPRFQMILRCTPWMLAPTKSRDINAMRKG